MVQLFRRIRFHLLKDADLKKYLLYAIGEILLIMVGILLAFQINTWNDNRIKKATERSYYRNIRDQITADKEVIQGQMAYNGLYMKQFSYANEIIQANDRNKLDTLGRIATKLTRYSDYNRQGNIYETLVSSGEIKLLQNLEIIKGVRELEDNYYYMNRMENIHYDAMMTYAVPALSTTLQWSTGEVRQLEGLYGYQFQNLILAMMQIMKEKHQTYRSAIDQIDTIIALIEEELNK